MTPIRRVFADCQDCVVQGAAFELVEIREDPLSPRSVVTDWQRMTIGATCIEDCERQDSNLHPLRDWILNPNADDGQPPTTTPLAPSGETGGADYGAEAVPDADLARLNASWATLPAHIRAAILALLDAAGR